MTSFSFLARHLVDGLRIGNKFIQSCRSHPTKFPALLGRIVFGDNPQPLQAASVPALPAPSGSDTLVSVGADQVKRSMANTPSMATGQRTTDRVDWQGYRISKRKRHKNVVAAGFSESSSEEDDEEDDYENDVMGSSDEEEGGSAILDASGAEPRPVTSSLTDRDHPMFVPLGSAKQKTENILDKQQVRFVKKYFTSVVPDDILLETVVEANPVPELRYVKAKKLDAEIVDLLPKEAQKPLKKQDGGTRRFLGGFALLWALCLRFGKPCLGPGKATVLRRLM